MSTFYNEIILVSEEYEKADLSERIDRIINRNIDRIKEEIALRAKTGFDNTSIFFDANSYPSLLYENTVSIVRERFLNTPVFKGFEIKIDRNFSYSTMGNVCYF